MKTLERLQQDVSLERLAQARGVQLKQNGVGLVGVCPFHERSKATLVIIPTSNTWTCPRCEVENGTVIEWTMKAEGVSRKHAVELLRSDHGTEGGPTKLVRQSTTRKLDTLTIGDDDVLMAQVVNCYHESLKADAVAMAFVVGLGFTAEMIDKFKVGFSDRTLAYRMPERNRKDGAALRARLHRLGILRDSGHETFRGCITVPIFDAVGRAVWMYGRRILLKKKAESPDVHLPGEPRGVWNVEAFEASREIILTGSILDAMAVWASGLRHVTAAVGGLTGDHLEALRRHGTEKVIIALPRDEAGDEPAEKLSVELTKMGIETFRVPLPIGLTVVEAMRELPSDDGLGQLIRRAEWMAKGKRTTSMTASTKTEKASPPAFSVIDPLEENVPHASSSSRASSSTTPRNGSGPGEIVLQLGDRRWRIRGAEKNTSFQTMRVNVFVSRDAEHPMAGFHVDNVELYSARQRSLFADQAADELGLEAATVKKDLGQVLLHLEGIQERAVREALEPNRGIPKITDGDRDAALDLLRDPALLDRIVADFDRCGVVGEETNKLVGYIATISRMLDDPLAVVIQSSSAAGKSSLMDAALAFVPEEDRVQYSAMTGQSLYYMEGGQLRHKVLAIAEEAGVERASYALKLLQSEGELTIASTAKEAGTGRLITHEYRVEGPVSIMMTTTAVEIDDELLNRCIVLTVDEGREQTRAIHQRQRERQTLEGLLGRRDRDRVLHVHQNAQRLLRPLPVVNPFVRELTFLDTRTRTRRDHGKYLTLIRAITLLHQHQRAVKRVEHEGRAIEYIEATKADIAVADRLAHEVLGRSVDELPPHTRRVLELLDVMVTTECEARKLDRADVRFSRREARERLGLGGTQLWIHLHRLVEEEYLLVHPSGRGRGVVFELAYTSTVGTVRGDQGSNSGGVRPIFGPNSGEFGGNGNPPILHRDGSIHDPVRSDPENGHKGTGATYVVPVDPAGLG